MLYLTTYNKDFKGGRFIFVDGVEKNRTISSIEPKKGRVSAFTSGHENRHHVEKVTEGTRYEIMCLLNRLYLTFFRNIVDLL